jgi:hypothetical protein
LDLGVKKAGEEGTEGGAWIANGGGPGDNVFLGPLDYNLWGYWGYLGATFANQQSIWDSLKFVGFRAII